MTLACYVAHPVGQPPDREANLARALRWFSYLVRTYDNRAFSMPWLPYCLTLPETQENRARGIRDDLVQLRLCSEIVLVGGHLSPGMRHELELARTSGMRVLNLLELGAEPPEVTP